MCQLFLNMRQWTFNYVVQFAKLAKRWQRLRHVAVNS
jgi:hypothetical protein